MTGGRLRRLADYLDGPRFCLTYGDCVADIDITRQLAFHEESGAKATLTAVQPPGRFGSIQLMPGTQQITRFMDTTVWEQEPLHRMAAEGKLFAYTHSGFWHPMDTLRDRVVLEEYWTSGKPPWRVW